MKQIFLRGLPGSGKSTVALLIPGVIVSADFYFYDKHGEYKFKGHLVPTAHEWAKEQCHKAHGAPVVIVDNTNIKRSDMEGYILPGYEVIELMVGNLHDVDLYFERCSHNVPKSVIERMSQEFEE